MGMISALMRRFRPVSQDDLPDEAKPCRWGYTPKRPYIVIDCDPHAEAVLGLSRTHSLDSACRQFAERLKVQPVANTHGVLDSRGVVVLGASPTTGNLYSGCEIAWQLMDRYLDPVDAAIYETMAKDGAPV